MKEFSQKQLESLGAFVPPGRFSTGQSNRELHLHDISPHQGILPAGIIWPMDTQEVAEIMSWCYTNDIPVTPWGAGTSTEGNPVPARGGLVMDLTQTNQILEIRPQDLKVDIQPGVLRKKHKSPFGPAWSVLPPRPWSRRDRRGHDRQ